MNRKEFLFKSFLASVGLSLIPKITFGKDSLTNQKLNLIGSLKVYAQEHMELNFKNDFFSKWSTDESPHYYLYVSEAHQVKSPKGIKDYLYFGPNKEMAIKNQKYYLGKGYHTLLYTRDGAHDFTVTNSLLAYDNESVALLIFHEAAHQHFKKSKMNLFLEEGACEVFGTFGAQFFAEINDTVDLKKVKKLNNILEKSYEVINKTIVRIGADEDLNEKLYRRLENNLFNDFKDSGSFIQQRFIYPVNNAYLLKNQYFAEHFDLLKKVAKKDKFINTFLYTLESLPKKEEKAIEVLKSKLSAD